MHEADTNEISARSTREAARRPGLERANTQAARSRLAAEVERLERDRSGTEAEARHTVALERLRDQAKELDTHEISTRDRRRPSGGGGIASANGSGGKRRGRKDEGDAPAPRMYVHESKGKGDEADI